jgi:fibronectin-binding autotransporter adhesin
MKAKTTFLLLPAALVAVLTVSSTVEAAVLWKDSSAENLNLVTSWWTTETGTTDPAAIAATDTLRFGGSGQAASISGIALGGDLAVGALRLDNLTGTPNYNVVISAGGVLTLNANNDYTSGLAQGMVLNSGTGGSLTVNANVLLGNNQRWVTSRALAVGGDIDLNAKSLTLWNAGNGSTTMTGVISNGSLVQEFGAATGTTILGGNNTYAGGTTIKIGILRVANHDTALGSGAVAFTANATLATANGGGARNIANAITVASGATASLDGGFANLTLSGGISGAGSITAVGAGTVILSGSNSYTGSTGINQGVLRINGTTTLGGTAASIVDLGNIVFGSGNANGTLEFETAAQLGVADQIRFRNSSGTAGNGGNLKFTGSTDVVVGKTIFGDSGTGMRLESDSTAGSVTYNGTFLQTNRALYLGGTGAGNNALSMSYAGSATLTKRGTGKWILNGTNTYTGGTELIGGTLEIDSLARLGTRVAPLDNTGYLAVKLGATLRYTGTATESTSRRLFMDNGTATIDIVDANASLVWDDDSNVAKSGNFIKAGPGALSLADPLTGAAQTVTVNAGTLTLSGVNTYTGATTINAGKLLVSQTGRLGAGAIVNASQLEFDYGTGLNVIASNAISGAGSIVKAGAGSLSLSGAVSSTGPITAQGGTLRLRNELAAPVTIATGATVATGTNAAIGYAATGLVGTLTLASGSASVFRIDTGTNHDRFYIDQDNQFTIAGPHVITPVIAGTPLFDEAFPVFDYTGVLQGNAADFQLPAGTRFELVHNLVNTSIDLVYKGGELLWTGGTGDWDVDLTSNWTLAGDSTKFFTSDRALFNDTASTGTVQLVGTIAPSVTTFQNETLAYTLSGSPLSGIGTVTKSGAATTTFLMNSTYSGGTTVNGGKLRIGDGGLTGDIGSGAVAVAAGATVEFHRTNAVAGVVDLDYKTNAKLRNVSGAGDVILTGGAILFSYPGSGIGFTESNSWSGFSGNFRVRGGSEFRTIRNGATAMGTGTVILGDGGSSGSLAQIEGSWTWTNPVSLVGADNAIINRSGALAGGRTLKLQGVISGAGGLRFRDVTPSMTDVNKGFVLTGENTMSGTLTIEAGVPVRIGGVPGNADVTSLNADAFGSLGAATVVNNGSLTFSRTDAITVANGISGTGQVRIGIPAAANLGNTSTQVVTYTGQATYEGATTVNNGSLLLDGGASIAGTTVTVAAGATLGGSGTVTAAVAAAGIISPGTGVGTLTLGATTLSGTYVCDVSGAQSDQIIAGTLDLTGATLQINGTPTANSYTIATYTGTLVGSFSGTLPQGYALNTSTAGEIRLVKSGTDFSNWMAGFYPGETDPAIIGLNADPDGDGVPNGVEFVLKNGHPAQANGTTMPSVSRVGDTLFFSFERDDRAKGPNSGIVLTAEAGATLQSWPKSYAIPAATQAPVTITQDGDSGPDTVTVAIPLEGATSQFARLKVAPAPQN